MTGKGSGSVRTVVENIVIPVLPGAGGAACDASALREAEKILEKAVGVRPDTVRVRKRSTDARHIREVKLVYSVLAEFSGLGAKEAEKLIRAGFGKYSEPSFDPVPGKGEKKGEIAVVGFGPAGMFCALALAERGYRPVVFERGSSVAKRVKKVSLFLSGGELDPECNVQFGAGGAGTFSDGKLTTRIGDPLVSYVLKRLAEFGAPEDVVWKARPHVGTDLLRGVVENIDARIRSLGGRIFYDTAVTVRDGALFADGEKIDCCAAVLAVGHSARDTYEELMKDGFSVVPKPFSAGVRIEHLQDRLDRTMLGDFAGDPAIGHAEYSLSHKTGGRGVYSFCMCPGGTVIASTSEAGCLVTNGMRNRCRDGRCANAALAVSVLPADHGGTPQSAILFQRELERAAFKAGGGDYSAPVQLVGDFLRGSPSKKLGSVVPTYMDGRVTPCDLRAILPAFIGDAIAEGILAFEKKIRGFSQTDAPLTGVETRTSAPVRVLRNGAYEAEGRANVYPCGEGAGYAGGIVSAAADGLRIAASIISKYSPD